MTVKVQAVAQEGLGLNLGICLGVFYTTDGMIGDWGSEWLQNALIVLIGLFRGYRLVKNVAKSRTMKCQPKHYSQTCCRRRWVVDEQGWYHYTVSN